ncbi:MAG: hypothetical protein ACW99E_22370, partial [Promethearchaeota archaeon]
FFVKNHHETLKAIESIIQKKQINGGITVKKIRVVHNIKSSNKSKINFIWRSLVYLEEKELIVLINTKPCKTYTVKNPALFNVERILSQAIKTRKEN